MTRYALTVAVLLTPVVAAAGPDDPPDGAHVWRHTDRTWERDYNGGPIPEGGHIDERRHELLVQGGLGTFLFMALGSELVAWFADLGCAGCTDHSFRLLYLPLAGPVIAAAMPGVERAGPGWQVLAGFDGALQIGGLIVGLIGHFWHSQVLVVYQARIQIAPTTGGLRLTF